MAKFTSPTYSHKKHEEVIADNSISALARIWCVAYSRWPDLHPHDPLQSRAIFYRDK